MSKPHSKKKPGSHQSLQQNSAPQPLTVEQAIELATQHHNAGRLSQAEDIYHQVLQVQPNNIDALHLLGLIAAHLKHYESAIELIQKAIRINPTVPQFYHSLGKIFSEQGQLAEAIACYQRALTLNPKDAEIYSSLGNVSMAQGNQTEAAKYYQQAIALNKNFADAYTGLGNVRRHQGQLTEAIQCCQRALTLRPQDAMAHRNLACVLNDKGMFQQAREHFKKALEILPTFKEAHSIFLFCLNYFDNPATIFSEHQQFNQQHALPLAFPPFHLNDRQSHRQLKIGYLSQDFRKHSVAYFIEPILAHHDPLQVEIYCYYNNVISDEVTQRCQKLATHWLNCVGLSDEMLIEKIQQDQIDILVDLMGHTGNRLLVFARKPAPISITYLGYPTTTGLTAIDYRLTDNYVDPEGETEQFNAEKLLRMPHSYFCYRPDKDSPPVSDLPALRQGYLTFGSFNHYTKINPDLLTLWFKILTAVPNSRLFLKSNSQHLNDPTTRPTMEQQFARAGIAAERLILATSTPSQEAHLKTYYQVDIGLDTYPYNGATTTCEALWMGVPVVTLAGNTHVSRMGSSILAAVGLPELVAQTPEEYVNICVKLASDIHHLQTLRAELRNRMQSSPLMDAPAFTRQLEALYREIWENWCNQQSSVDQKLFATDKTLEEILSTPLAGEMPPLAWPEGLPPFTGLDGLPPLTFLDGIPPLTSAGATDKTLDEILGIPLSIGEIPPLTKPEEIPWFTLPDGIPPLTFAGATDKTLEEILSTPLTAGEIPPLAFDKTLFATNKTLEELLSTPLTAGEIPPLAFDKTLFATDKTLEEILSTPLAAGEIPLLSPPERIPLLTLPAGVSPQSLPVAGLPPLAQKGIGENFAPLPPLSKAGKAGIALFSSPTQTEPVYQTLPIPEAIQLATQLHQQGELQQAETIYRQVLEVEPDNLDALHLLGVIAAQTLHYDAAIELFNQAIQLDDTVPSVYNSLGSVFGNQNLFAEAASYYQKALALDSKDADLHSNLAYALRAQGQLAEALAIYQQALLLQPDNVTIHQDYLFTLNYASHYSAAEIYAEHLKFDKRHTARLASIHRNPRQPQKRLKIGYVSPDLRKHTVGYFMAPLLENQNHQQFEIFCYYNHAQSDEFTEQFKQSADQWRACAGMTDEALTNQIRQDGIDILVDLSSHMRGNRLLVFARKPAPIQVTYLGNPSTTGLKTMDYRLTDWHTDPVGFEAFNSEQLMRLPDSFFCYRPPQDCPPVADLPMLREGHITFGSCNALIKLNATVINLWANILTAVPHSRLLLKTHGLTSVLTKQELTKRFTDLGISAERLILLESSAPPEHLYAYHQIDIGLDTFPFNGGTTTCEALWMGVPVITLAGDRSVSRLGASILSVVGLPQLIATTAEEYVTIAIKLAQEVPILRTLRAGLRDQMTHSALMDGPRFARQVEALYREMWEKWCKKKR
jgi:predicted O-linked N-acetylglucosamine transferase (SPINDLY family)